MPQKFNEWQIGSDGTKIKQLRTVSIEPQEAEMLNGDSKITRVMYEAAEAEPVYDRKELFAILEARGVTVPKNAKTELLLEKIKETEPVKE